MSKSMKRLYRISLICGATPLAVGITMFAVWYFTRWDSLISLGILAFYGGLVVFFLGITCLSIYLWREFRKNKSFSRQLKKQGLLSGSILFANFPIAAIIIALVIRIMTVFTVVVANNSEYIVDSFLLITPGVNVELGPIAPTKEAKHSFYVAGDGVLKFEAQQGSDKIEGIVEGYVTSSMGGYKRVTIEPAKSFTVEDMR